MNTQNGARSSSVVQRHNPYNRQPLLPTLEPAHPVGAGGAGVPVGTSQSRLLLQEVADEIRKASQDIAALQKDNKGICLSVSKLVEETKKLVDVVRNM